MEKKQTILVIFPDGEKVAEFREMLAESYELICVKTEEEGFRLLEEGRSKIAAVLLDLALARASDFQYVERVNQDALFAAIPIIAILPRPPVHEDMICLEKGISDLITPPCEAELVAKRIHNAIRAKDSATFYEIERMLKELPSNIYLKDAEGRYVFATHYWDHLDRHGDPNWTIRGKTDLEIRKDKLNAAKALESDKKLLATGEGTSYIIEENIDGKREFLQLIKRPVFDDCGRVNGIIALINDVTETQLLKMELEKRSKTDPLTGLLNKGATEELVHMLIESGSRSLNKGALLMIDADRFKAINDTFGHAAGDNVLMTIGKLLHAGFKGKDVGGRVGGDEFMVFIRDIEGAETACELAKRLEDQARHAFDGQEMEGCVSLSIGIALFPEHGESFEELYDAADQALYYVKEHGRANYQLYDPERISS